MMTASVNPPYVMWRKRSVVILLLTILIQNVTCTSDLASTLKLRKCHCDKDQAWDGVECHPFHTELPIYNKDFDLQNDEINLEKYATTFSTIEVENVTISKLECPEDLFPSLLLENALLLPDGRMLWLDPINTNVFTNDVFCVEHFLDHGNLYFDVPVCLPPPHVPHCCPANHLLHQDGSCHPQKAFQAPPIQLGNHKVNWDRVGGDMMTPTCGAHEHYRHISLATAEGSLSDEHPTATLEWKPPFWMASHYWRKNYCVALQETEAGELTYVAQICFKDHTSDYEHRCGGSACIRKCCSENQLLRNYVCHNLKNDEVWRPLNSSDQWKIVTGELGCSAFTYEDEMRLLSNGSLLLGGEGIPVDPSRYCLDNVADDDGNISSLAMICFLPKDTTCVWRNQVIKVVLGVSCVFLTLTLAVYLGVAELRDHTYGRCLISMVTAMLTAYICLLCNTEVTYSRATCQTLAFFSHMSALAVFFWLNVMCFDMWKILRGSVTQHHSKKVFLAYSLYAWGCPLVVSTVALALDIAAPSNIILPEFFDGSCFFKEDRAYWAYYSSFVLVLVLVNIGFFTHVGVTLHRKMKERAQTFESGSNRTNRAMKPTQRAWLFAKLFLVMGVIWITDALSAISHRNTCSYWVFSEIINGLQGLFIFIVAVCNKDNLKKVKDAWSPRLQGMRKTLTGMSHSQHTTRNTLSVDDTDASRKTSITSISRKISQASNILFHASSKKTATLDLADPSKDSHSGRKASNVSVKDIIPLSTMEE